MLEETRKILGHWTDLEKTVLHNILVMELDGDLDHTIDLETACPEEVQEALDIINANEECEEKKVTLNVEDDVHQLVYISYDGEIRLMTDQGIIPTDIYVVD